MSNTLDPKVKQSLTEMKDDVLDKFKTLKSESSTDLEIDEVDLDTEVLKTPKLHSKYLNMYSEEVIRLKDLYSFSAKVKLERWKYWNGKQTDEYYARNGIQHEKILKTDIEKYLNADEKMTLVNDIITIQKTIVEHLEKVLKEIGTRNFHIKAAIDWRKFTSGA